MKIDPCPALSPRDHRRLAMSMLAGALATACITPAEPPSEPLPLPFVLSDYYSPDGFFGDGEKRGQLQLDKTCPGRAAGSAGDCYTITYRLGDKKFAGIFWQHPHNNWGFWPGHRVAPGAKKITFKVRGDRGGEVVSFGAGQMGMNEHNDVFKLEQKTVGLTTDWKDEEVAFNNADYQGQSGVIGAFVVSIPAPESGTAKFYLDDVRWQ